MVVGRSMGPRSAAVVLFVRSEAQMSSPRGIVRKKTKATEDGVNTKLGIEFALDVNDPTHLVLDDLLALNRDAEK